MQLIADAMNDVRTSGKTVASIARRVIDHGRPVLEEYTREREEEVVDWYVEEDRIAEWATETHVLSRRLMRIEIPVTYDGPAPRDLADTAHRTQGAHTT